jgi:hypothetical protein
VVPDVGRCLPAAEPRWGDSPPPDHELVTVDDHRLMSEDDPRTRLGSVNDQPLAGGGPAIPAADPQH